MRKIFFIQILFKKTDNQTNIMNQMESWPESIVMPRHS